MFGVFLTSDFSTEKSWGYTKEAHRKYKINTSSASVNFPSASIIQNASAFQF